MVKFLALAVTIGTLGGVGGGTLAATVYGTHASSVPRTALVLGQTKGFSVPAVGLAAGDEMERPLDLKNAGKVPFSAVSLTSVASSSSDLDTDPVNGLQLRVDSCSSGWKKVKRTLQYACNYPITTLVPLRPVIGSDVVLQGLALGNGKTAHLLLTVSLPPGAPNSLQGRTTSVSYTFTAA